MLPGRVSSFVLRHGSTSSAVRCQPRVAVNATKEVESAKEEEDKEVASKKAYSSARGHRGGEAQDRRGSEWYVRLNFFFLVANGTLCEVEMYIHW